MRTSQLLSGKEAADYVGMSWNHFNQYNVRGVGPARRAPTDGPDDGRIGRVYAPADLDAWLAERLAEFLGPASAERSPLWIAVRAALDRYLPADLRLAAAVKRARHRTDVPYYDPVEDEFVEEFETADLVGPLDSPDAAAYVGQPQLTFMALCWRGRGPRRRRLTDRQSARGGAAQWLYEVPDLDAWLFERIERHLAGTGCPENARSPVCSTVRAALEVFRSAIAPENRVVTVVYTPRQAAEYKGVAFSTFERWVRQGLGPRGHRSGKGRAAWYTREELDAWVPPGGGPR